MLNFLKLDFKLFKRIDFSIIITSIIIMFVGMYSIYVSDQSYGLWYAIRQFIWFIVGIILTYLILLIDYNLIGNYIVYIYWIFNLLLVYLIIQAKAINGSASWLGVGSFGIQPSEFAKIAMIVLIAKKINDLEDDINRPKNIFTLLLYGAIPMALIVVQPDMGLTMVCFFILLGIFYYGGIKNKYIITALLGVVILVVGIWNFPNLPRQISYWKVRLASFVNPEEYELSEAYQVIYAKRTIGIGGLNGTGDKFGPNAPKNYASSALPEATTDGIFAVFAEKWGFLGCLFLLSLYGFLLYKILSIAQNSKDIYGSLICIGIFSMLLFSIFQNIGMLIGLMPVTGITLPFMSHGGSSVMSNFIALGLVINVGMRRKRIDF